MKHNIWLMNHYATKMYFDRDGRHYWFARYLNEQAYKVSIICSSVVHGEKLVKVTNHSPIASKEVDGIQFVFLRTSSNAENQITRIISMLQFFYRLITSIKKIRNLAGSPDAIIASSAHLLTCLAGLIVARILKVPCIIEIRDLWPESLVEYGILNRSNPVIKLLYLLELYIYRNADRIVFTMEGGREYLKDKQWNELVDLRKVVHINNGVDLAKFRNDIQKNGKCIPELLNEATFNCVYSGSVRLTNRIDVLVDAAEMIDKDPSLNVKVLIFGNGDQKERLEKIVHDKKITSIKFCGQLPKSQIPSILSKSDACILDPCNNRILRYGISANKLFDYLASERPIIAVKYNYDIVGSNGCGVTITESSPHSVVEAIKKLASLDSETYSDMQHAARRTASMYDYRLLTNKMERVIMEVISDKKGDCASASYR